MSYASSYAFIQCDYPQLELYALAQCCLSWFGQSRLAEVLLADQDPHLMVAATILKISYEEAVGILKDETHAKHALVKKIRQQSKPFNFGKPGGMGDATLLKTTRKQMGRKEFAKLELDEAEAARLTREWKATWPEMAHHFRRIEELINESDTGRATVTTLFTERTRGNATFCATANNGFQALGADCAKHAAWLLARACYVDRTSPLFNSRMNVLVHDEFIGETPYEPDEFGIDERAHHAAYELRRVMVKGANKYLVDVPMKEERTDATMMLRWYKDASPVFITRPGETKKWLVPSKVVKINGKKISVFDDARLIKRAA